MEAVDRPRTCGERLARRQAGARITSKGTAMTTAEQFFTIAWPGGMMGLRCIGVEPVGDNQVAIVQEAMEQFATESHLMFIWYIGVLNSREAIQRQLSDSIAPESPVAVVSARDDGTTRSIRTRVRGAEATDAIARGAEFERLYARSHIISVFTLWEELIRPKIADALGVDRNAVTSDLMGDWRHLRNWLVHPKDSTEEDYFNNAQALSEALGSQRGRPEITAGGVLVLMERLNALAVVVNPHNQEPLTQFVPPDPETWAKIQRSLGPNDRVLPMWPGGTTSEQRSEPSGDLPTTY